MAAKRYAIIDIGSLKVKLLIAEETTNGFSPLHQSTVMTRLGLRINENGGMPFVEHVQATIAELKQCKALMDEYGVTQFRAIATHALREIPDGQVIALAMSEESGIPIEIISQEQEAELFFQAVLHDFSPRATYAVADVGSSSVQLLIGKKNKLQQFYLFKTGSQRLMDLYSPRHDPTDFPSNDEIETMRQMIRKELQLVPENANVPLIYGSTCIIPLMQALRLPLQPFKQSPHHPYRIPLSVLEQFLTQIIPVPYGERDVRYPFEQKYYMWGIDKALLNIVTIGQHIGSQYVIPSNANIAQGLLYSLAETNFSNA